METIFAILTVIVYILLALVGLVALTICVFLWLVSTRTRQDSKIFQERFDGWRKFAPKARLSGLSFHPLPCGPIRCPDTAFQQNGLSAPSRSDPAAIPRPRNASARIIVYISFSPRIFSRTPSSPFRAPPPYWF